MKDKMTSSQGHEYIVMIVTVAMAHAFLETMPGNRKLRMYHVNQLAEEMLRGTWRYGADPIKINEKGVLFDGQHRLKAIILSGKPQLMLIVKGLPEETFINCDSGKTRNLADVLYINSANSAKYPSVISVATRFLYMWDTFGRENISESLKSGQKEVSTNTDYLKYYNTHSLEINRALDFIIATKKGCRSQQLIGPGKLVAYYCLFARKSVKDTQEFIGKFITGEELQRSNPIYRVRETLMKFAHNATTSRFKGARLSSERKFVYLVKAWNAYRTGATPSSFAIYEKTGIPAIK